MLSDSFFFQFQNVRAKSESDPDPDKREYLAKEVSRLVSLLDTPESEKGVAVLDILTNKAHDAIADILDKEHGDSVTDHEIFATTAKRFEQEYHADMKALNVRAPIIHSYWKILNQ